MNNAGVYLLGNTTITTALTNEVVTEGVSAQSVAQSLIDRLEGMNAVTIVAEFAYGSGGTSVAAIVQTAVGSNGTWFDVARFEFTTSTAQKYVNLAAGAAASIAALSALGSETKVDGMLGDRLRLKLTTVGTYAGGTTLAVRACVR